MENSEKLVYTPVYNGHTAYKEPYGRVTGEYVERMGESFYKISHYDAMPPFFMTIVSDADHWLFISSSGGLTAGRKNAYSALFPYYTVDKVTENYENTGSKTILIVERDEKKRLWEPFSDRFAGFYRLQRNVYKNLFGNVIIFEEINHDLRLTFRYAWRSSDRYGFVRSAWLINTGEAPCAIEILDGLQNILPYGATSQVQSTLSNLLDAYKRSELEPTGAIGLFTLSSILTDLAEPSEALRAVTVWQSGLEPACYLLSSQQLDRFRQGFELTPETDARGRRGAFLVNAQVQLAVNAGQEWHIVADVNQEYSDIVSLRNALTHSRQEAIIAVLSDVQRGTEKLIRLLACADGVQLSADRVSAAHHLANVLFNIMRGGIFAQGYSISKTDLLDFIQTRNPGVFSSQAAFFEALPAAIELDDLRRRAAETASADIERLCYEYLPLTFSRRHGDPSRPWNTFSINLKQADGSPKLDYQGNWRDIFQNWEALACSYPGYIESMLCKFLNAITPDGYNPYRVTRDGIEWETPEPENPWANIGYWSDHQIIYLQKLCELVEGFYPGSLNELLNHRIFSHANVPYKIKSYRQILHDCYDTIEFDAARDRQIAEQIAFYGTDARLVRNKQGQTLHVSFAEKIVLILLAKLSNFIPEGGIWMNTQRPEWNDANNALVGKGLSMVTVYYLRRFTAFLRDLFQDHTPPAVSLTQDVKRWFAEIQQIFETYRPYLRGSFDDEARRAFMDAVGQAASEYRTRFYEQGVSAAMEDLPTETLTAFLTLTLEYLDHTIRANRREDSLYHAYNTLILGEKTATVAHLYIMLEGQVAALSSGLLQAQEAVELIEALRASALYRADQCSYMLYPNRNLPGFLAKNCVTAEQVENSELVAALTKRGDSRLLVRDEQGQYHFHGGFRNAKDVKAVLEVLKTEPEYAELARKDAAQMLRLFEEVFDHQSFTGRSGTFFAYEGLGSIYWHMVSKLLLAVQENYVQAVKRGEQAGVLERLAEQYYDIRSGLGFNKSPEAYGAFPTDPYSHTPAGQGAKQPGMTGQVKEEILTRFGEMGVFVEGGEIVFNPILLRQQEFLAQAQVFCYLDVHDQPQEIPLPAGSLAYTFCQTPIVYQVAETSKIEVSFADGGAREIPDNRLEASLSRHIFRRDGSLKLIRVYCRVTS